MIISVGKCYRLAWKSFRKWWIPLCLISLGVVVFDVLPKLQANAEIKRFENTVHSVLRATLNGDPNALAYSTDELKAEAYEALALVGKWTLYLFPAVALLTVILLMVANFATKNKRTKGNSPWWLMYVALVHVALSLMKAAAVCLLIVPGVYLYIKLLFVSLVMLEQKKGPAAAIAASWRMTRGNFWPLLLLILLNSTVQLAVAPTIIGEIPVTGFVNTARAAAFRMLLDAEQSPAPPAPPGLADSCVGAQPMPVLPSVSAVPPVQQVPPRRRDA